jgi:hypothetical protein
LRKDEMNTVQEIQPVLRQLFLSQRYAVLATDEQGQPFTSLMAFSATEDLRRIVLLTERTRRKFINLKTNRRVALLIDNRENKGSDTQDAVAVTAIGDAEEACFATGAALLPSFLARHPALSAFAASPSCAVVTVKITSYVLVSRFEQVLEWPVES